MAGLLGTEKIPRTADLQISQSNFHPGSESRKITDGIEPFFRIFRKYFISAEGQIGTRPPGRPANPASDLMQLSKTQTVCILNDQRIDIGNVDTGFNDGGAHQNLRFPTHNTIHHVREHLLIHFAVGNGNCHLTAEKLCNFPCRAVNIVNPVVEIIHLPAALQFPNHGIGQQVPVMLHDKGLDRKPVFRRFFNVGHIPDAGHGHIHGAGNRCC